MEENRTPQQPQSSLETDADKGKAGPKITKKTAVVGAAIGIGSAAIVAALLYANRGSKS